MLGIDLEDRQNINNLNFSIAYFTQLQIYLTKSLSK